MSSYSSPQKTILLSLLAYYLTVPSIACTFVSVQFISDFTNQTANSMIESLANADEKGKIVCIKEIFTDYYVVDPEIFSLKLPSLMGKSIN